MVALNRDALARVGIVSDPVEAALPPPDFVAEQVARLRAVMFGAINPADVAAMMAATMQKAVGGDLKAVKLITDLLTPKAAPSASAQAAVFVNSNGGRRE